MNKFNNITHSNQQSSFFVHILYKNINKSYNKCMGQTYDKIIFGTLFKYYRNKNNLGRDDLIDRINSNDGKLSISTLRRIESGGYSSLSAYKILGKCLNKSITEDEIIYEKLNDLTKRTYEIINSGQPLSKYILLRNEIIKFGKKNNYLYINEISRLCIATLNMYLTCKVDDTEIISMLYSFIDNVKQNELIATLAYYLMCSYGYYYSRGSKESHKYLMYTSKLYNKNIIYIDEPFILSRKMDKYSYINHFQNEIYKPFSKKEAPLLKYRKYSLKSLYAFTVGNIVDAKKYILELINDVEIKQYIPNRILLHQYEVLAYIYMREGNLDNALKCFDYVIETNPNLLEISYAYVFLVAERLNKLDYAKKILENNRKYIQNVVTQHIFDYYSIKLFSKAPIKDLEKYIMDNFSLDICDSLQCYIIFKSELSSLVEESKNYKSFYLYLRRSEPLIPKYRNNKYTDFFEEDFLITI